ncbi:TetR/AcrR family transcriptional regulator [Streptomyces chartreusis]|uniref:TetR/AcrR family transcriptional regulator n=1 Tax=Streptomyces chartreusis TaxID=1969 RepID=UPI00340DABBD
MSSDFHPTSPRRMPRQSRAVVTRQRILSAAAHVITEHGYTASSTNRIAEQAHVSIGSLYRYFPNKGAILAELLMQQPTLTTPTGNATADEAESVAASNLADALRSIVRQTINHHRGDPLLHILIEEARHTPELAESLAHYEEERLARICRLLEHHPEVDRPDLEMAVMLTLSTVELVTHRVLAGRRPVDLQLLEDEIVRMLSRYLRSL